MAEKTPLRDRIRDAGGLYQWFNTTLIRLAGPPHVSPNLPRNRDADPCARCGRRKDEHRPAVDGGLRCPL
ncbi:hypothetical protein [Microbacterium rhizophilus]|uniref:hypothetical protein n=1 Tax=Microbacterium rhizophilus TaxID=3138934 RepID=UPI0031E89A23